MSRMTPSSQSAYDAMMGRDRPREKDAYGTLPRSIAPTIVKVADPIEPFEELAEQLMEAEPEGRKANRMLRKRQHERVSRDETGKLLLYGKACCGDAVMTLNRELDRLQLPYHFKCGKCGTLFVIEMRTREERRHV